MTAVEPIAATTRAHPLATQQGIAMLVQCITAGRLYRQLTPAQRQVMRALTPTVRDAANQAGRTQTAVEPVPVRAPAVTLAALTRRGLVHDGHLTVDGLAVAWWAS